MSAAAAAAAQERLVEDVLFLACTRPAMIAGAPLEAMALNLIVSTTAFLAGHSLLYLLVAPVTHLICAAVCRSDANAFRLLALYADTKGRARNVSLWGGSSAAPLAPLRRWRGAEARRG